MSQTLRRVIDDTVNTALPAAMCGHWFEAMAIIDRVLRINAGMSQLQKHHRAYKRRWVDKKYIYRRDLLAAYAAEVLEEFGQRPYAAAAA